MKLIIYLLLFLRTSYLAYPVVKTWTFHELAKEVERIPYHDPDNALVKAFDQMTTSVFRGQPNYVSSILLSPSGNMNWTMDQLESALRNIHTYIYFTPFIGQAYVELNDYNANSIHKKLDSVEVQIDALDISTWTKNDIKRALRDQSINPDLVPYLREALAEIKDKEIEMKQLKMKEDNTPRPDGLRCLTCAQERVYGKDRVLLDSTIITPVGLIPPPPGVLPLIVPRNQINYKSYDDNQRYDWRLTI